MCARHEGSGQSVRSCSIAVHSVKSVASRAITPRFEDPIVSVVVYLRINAADHVSGARQEINVAKTQRWNPEGGRNRLLCVEWTRPGHIGACSRGRRSMINENIQPERIR